MRVPSGSEKLIAYCLPFSLPASLYICNMHVDDALISKLARLSMLQFNEEEKEEIKSDLQKMIGFMDKILELDLDGVEPLLHICKNQDVLREDIPGNMLTREEALKNSGGQDGQYFIVPKTINKSGQ
jgi:aspartyl-tRNA(Asn)/glutamyl-tRNA(Gln) amidotransferase subunit C